MKHIDEYRKRELANGLLKKIRAISTRQVNIMEICGTHTHALSRYGIREALPANIHLISGPGCPVCVTSAADINGIISFTRERRDAIIATFGDMMKVPGSYSTLQEERAAGADIRVVYSPLGSIDMAKTNPDREVILYAVGFETTAPTVASTILLAELEGLRNFSVLSLHKLTPPAMKALMDSGEVRIDGFICPGHVTAIIGARAYDFLSTDYHAPCVVAGFEPLDVLYGLYMLIRQLEEGRCETEVEYDRVVSWEGNQTAQDIIEGVFLPVDSLWRGIGMIPGSGLGIKRQYSELDAAKKFSIERGEDAEPPGCRCGDVLKGLMPPSGCALFGHGCTPETPVGPCMVSSEGTCAAYYKYKSF